LAPLASAARLRRAWWSIKGLQAVSKRLVERVQTLRVGSGADPKTDMGPVINAERRKDSRLYRHWKARRWATLAYGGRRLTKGEYANGYFLNDSLHRCNSRHAHRPGRNLRAGHEVIPRTPSKKRLISATVCVTDCRHPSTHRRKPRFHAMNECTQGFFMSMLDDGGRYIYLSAAPKRPQWPSRSRHSGARCFLRMEVCLRNYSGKLQALRLTTLRSELATLLCGFAGTVLIAHLHFTQRFKTQVLMRLQSN